MKIREYRDYDVVVAGCGVAGFAAAVAAGRQGLKTAVVERQGMPGGILTVGGNNEIALFFAHHKIVIKGIGWAFCEELARRGEATIPDWKHISDHPALGVSVHPLAAAVLMDEWLAKVGVDLYYNQPIVETETHGENGKIAVDSVIIATKAGLKALRAKVFIDCSGDADLCAFAGADIECGDPETGDLMPGTLRYYQKQASLTEEQRASLRDRFRAARADGRLQFRDLWAEHAGSDGSQFYGGGNNIGHVMHYNAADSDSLTAAEVRGRQSVYRVMHWLRGNGYGGDVITAAPNVASRESRRVVCDTRVTAEDYVAGRLYDDAICYSFYPIDLHRSDEDGCLYNIFIKEGVYPTLPLSALVPAKLRNVFVAGRCTSGDRLAQSAFRVKSSCMAMGEAAGTAAAVALRQGTNDVRRADLEETRRVLRENGALVPPDAPLED